MQNEQEKANIITKDGSRKKKYEKILLFSHSNNKMGR